MDFLRKFIETAFCFYNCDLIGRVMNGNQPISNKELIINKNTFVSTMRRNHPEMSDDSINLIYRLFEDKWSKNPNNMVISQNLFYSLVHFTNAVLRTEVNYKTCVTSQTRTFGNAPTIHGMFPAFPPE